MNDSKVLLALNFIVFNHMHCFNECSTSYGLVDILLKYGLDIHPITFNLYHSQLVNIPPSSHDVQADMPHTNMLSSRHLHLILLQ
jgi:hypothetical protein